jgi:hypothetical protein
MTELSEPVLRHEFKYELAPMQYQVLKKKVSLLFKLDPFAGPDCGYRIRNLYFDDFRNTSLYEKWAGAYHRKKYRIRIYDLNDKKIKFERKTKIGEYILKEDARLTRKEADQIISGDFGFLVDSKNCFLKTLYVESRKNLLRPAVIVEYYREAFYDPKTHIRITFDSDLRMGLNSVSIFDPKVPTMRVIDESNIVMEIKFSHSHIFPHYIQGLFAQDTQPRLAIGKYALCRAQQMCLSGGAIKGPPCAKACKTFPQDEECIN